MLLDAKVLVVDSDPVAGELIRSVLQAADMRTEVVADAEAARVRLDRERFDIILLDQNLPGSSGAALARSIRSGGYNRRSHIVMVTADQSPQSLGQAFEAGASMFLFKPIDKTRLLRIVRASGSGVQQEKRRSHRVPLSCRVTVTSNREEIEGTTLDLSMGGFLMSAPRTFPEGSRLAVRLQFPAGRPPLPCVGRVARVLDANRMGVEMLSVTAADNERLQGYLLPHILAGAGPAPVPVASVAEPTARP